MILPSPFGGRNVVVQWAYREDTSMRGVRTFRQVMKQAARPLDE